MSNVHNIALIGNPNVGKTVIFNCLTGSRAHVANWPGVTVEKKTGKMGNIHITDLPGVYSLTPSAIDGLIARNFIIDNQLDLIVDILDVTNLERNLYLGLLLKEMGVPVLFVLNMIDIAREKKITIQPQILSEFVKAPVLTTAAIKDEGINELKSEINKLVIDKSNFHHEYISYSDGIEQKIKSVISILNDSNLDLGKNLLRYYAIKLLEKDADVEKTVLRGVNESQLAKRLAGIRSNDDQISLASDRYSFINGVIKKSLKKDKTSFDPSQFLDRFFLDRKIGIPIFLLIMWGLFEFTFRVATPFMTLIEVILGGLGDLFITWIGENIWSSFIVDGIINGFGSIIIFLPNIFLMFLMLSFLEDSGYLSRAAFVMDRLMYKIGLHGRSFVSMLLGFGCNVPAIMSTRAIESEDDRITTIMANQNMSCGARLPVYILIGGTIWGAQASSIIFGLYAIGIIVAILVALTFKKLVFKGDRVPFILEIGDFTRPTAKYTAIHMWERGREFLKKAGTIIFVVVIIMWVLEQFPLNHTDPTQSWLYQIGVLIEPIFKPLHFGIIPVVGIIFGFLAKEVVVAAFGTMLKIDEGSETLGGKIFEQLGNSSIVAFSYLVFILLYTPCVAVVATIKRETGSWKWAIISIIYSFILAYFGAFLVQLLGGVYF